MAQMTNEDAQDMAPEDIGKESGLSSRKERQAFRRLSRELSEADLTEVGVQKLLLENVDRLETENEELKSFRARFHEADRENVILREKRNTTRSFEILYAVGLTIGACLLGIAPAIWSVQPAGWIVAIAGAVLIFGGVAAKATRR